MSRRPAVERLAATAIVLAGGRSSRSGSDKLTVDLGGEPLLHRAIRAVAGICSEAVVGPSTGLSTDLLARDEVSVILDAAPFPDRSWRSRAPRPRPAMIGFCSSGATCQSSRRCSCAGSWRGRGGKGPACSWLVRLSPCRWAWIARRDPLGRRPHRRGRAKPAVADGDPGCRVPARTRVATARPRGAQPPGHRPPRGHEATAISAG